MAYYCNYASLFHIKISHGVQLNLCTVRGEKGSFTDVAHLKSKWVVRGTQYETTLIFPLQTFVFLRDMCYFYLYGSNCFFFGD